MPDKKRRLSSEVWDYFDIIPKKDPNEESKCRCKKCGNEYSAESKSGTSNLHRHLSEECNSSDDFMRRIASQMLVKFNKYWSEFNLLLAIVVVFDPRYKFQFIEFSYNKLYGPGSIFCWSEFNFMRRIASQMLVKFNKYWSEFNLLLAIAVVFDPQYKFQFIEFSYNKLYGPGSNELVKVRNALFDAYNEYVKNSNISGASSSCSRDLSKLARDILCIPVATVASESAFSLGGRILDQFRSSLSPQIVEALVCTKDWISKYELEDLTQNIMSLNINKDEVDATIIEDSNSNVVNL
ncbi:zinc finger BED domain-containing protein RICESLEEPER 4-like [Coffea eugenioides]|uniref:zinc finger BED domain-containing protein RICESLEEPER 4-like n=1 Tax=Coffea eugenioides TaxID=49369 RepID=UPI000F60C4B2|nr:zinc finger BED domain-containing protein RICESLEEPER 4-like [Coffea eugenioides]